MKKEETYIIIYDKEPGDDFYGLDINFDYGDYIGKPNVERFAFQDELDELEIYNYGDEYIYEGELTKYYLSDELMNRGFNVIFR